MGKIRIIIAGLFIPVALYGDTGDKAVEWVKNNARALSVELCRAKVENLTQNSALNYYNVFSDMLFEVADIKTRLFSIEKDILEAEIEVLDKTSNLLKILMAEKKFLHASETEVLLLRRAEILHSRLEETETRFNTFNKEKISLLHQRPEIFSGAFLPDVSLWDGINFATSTDPATAVLLGLLKGYESHENYRRNRTINKKMQGARDLFNKLQVSQDEFSMMVLDAFKSQNDAYRKKVEKTKILLNELRLRLLSAQDFTTERFALLDNLRMTIIQKKHERERDIKWMHYEKEWLLEDLKIFEAEFKGNLAMKRAMAILKMDESVTMELKNEEKLFSAYKDLMEEN